MPTKKTESTRKTEPAERAYAFMDGETIIVPSCPYCGGRHVHGAGGAKRDSYDFGTRVAHCKQGGDYLLINQARAEAN